MSCVESGRGGAIRTLDLLNPIQVRYQAAPRPEGDESTTRRAVSRSVATAVLPVAFVTHTRVRIARSLHRSAAQLPGPVTSHAGQLPA